MPEPNFWTDRFGCTHREKSAHVPDHDGKIPRMPEVPDKVAKLIRKTTIAALPPNPIVSECGLLGMRDYTWLMEAPAASAVLLWVNGIFNHSELDSSEFSRLPGSQLWALTLRLPSSWRASYRIAVWEGNGIPPWRSATDRFSVRTAAMQLLSLDPRGGAVVGGSHGPSSLAAGPDSPAENWHVGGGADCPSGMVHEHTFAATERYGKQRVWVYEPTAFEKARMATTPLLILFDGQVWKGPMGLPAILDAAIAGGVLPPLHVAMVDSMDMKIRWAELGVPAGQVDFVFDELLDIVRAQYAVNPTSDATIVSGQSFGGLAAIWALALGGDKISHAIAQSPSLWRFDMAELLRQQPDWLSLHIQAGRFEEHILADANVLLQDLTSTGDTNSHVVTLEAMEGGHDWAWWRAGLLSGLAQLLGE